MIVGHENHAYGFCLCFCKPYNTQSRQNSRTVCTDLTLQRMRTPIQLGHVSNMNGFISTSISSIKSKGEKNDRTICTRNMMTSSNLGYLINVFVFISTSISPITTRLHRKRHQHAMTFLCR